MKTNIKIIRIPPSVPKHYLNKTGIITAHKGLKRVVMFDNGDTWCFHSNDLRVVKDKPVLILRPAKRRKMV